MKLSLVIIFSFLTLTLNAQNKFEVWGNTGVSINKKKQSTYQNKNYANDKTYHDLEIAGGYKIDKYLLTGIAIQSIFIEQSSFIPLTVSIKWS